MKQTNRKHKTVELGAAHVPIIADCLTIVKTKYLDEYCIDKDEQEFIEGVLDDLIENFCNPLIQHGKDIKIILKGEWL